MAFREKNFFIDVWEGAIYTSGYTTAACSEQRLLRVYNIEMSIVWNFAPFHN